MYFGKLNFLGLISLLCISGNRLQIVLHVMKLILGDYLHVRETIMVQALFLSGTPESTWVHKECFPYTTTHRLLCFSVLPFIPQLLNLYTSLLCGTVLMPLRISSWPCHVFLYITTIDILDAVYILYTISDLFVQNRGMSPHSLV